MPDIRIYGNSGSAKKPSSVFRTTAHELGHAAHCTSMGNIQYWQVSKIIYESWADAVEWALTNQEYRELGITYDSSYDNYGFNKQTWPHHGKDKAYSSLFIDLVDNYNQSKNNTSSREYPNDNVTGYSMRTLSWYIMPKSYGLSSLKSRLKANKPYRVSDKQIDELFERYEETW